MTTTDGWTVLTGGRGAADDADLATAYATAGMGVIAHLHGCSIESLTIEQVDRAISFRPPEKYAVSLYARSGQRATHADQLREAQRKRDRILEKVRLAGVVTDAIHAGLPMTVVPFGRLTRRLCGRKTWQAVGIVAAALVEERTINGDRIGTLLTGRLAAKATA